MVFCVPDGFLRRGGGTAHLERAARREEGNSGPPHQDPGVPRHPAWHGPVRNLHRGVQAAWMGGESAWRARPSQDATLAQNLTADKPQAGTTCCVGEVVYPTDNSKLNLKGAESVE